MKLHLMDVQALELRKIISNFFEEGNPKPSLNEKNNGPIQRKSKRVKIDTTSAKIFFSGRLYIRIPQLRWA